MKDHIPNSSSQDFTPSNKSSSRMNPEDNSSLKRLYVITGKGGVGKTSLSLALTRFLHSKGHNVLYNSFDRPPSIELCNSLDIPYFDLKLEESTKSYMAQKLGSQVIAFWIMKTPFFNSLLNILPGLGQMILMGHLVNKLEEDPSLIIVLDSPSSGHAITMFESTYNFYEMFKTGPIVSDIKRMHNFLYHQENLQTIITCLPTLMATNEGLELKKTLKTDINEKIDIIMNSSFDQTLISQDIDYDELPDFLAKKIDLEKSVINQVKGEIKVILPYLPSLDFTETVKALTPYMEQII